MWERVVRFMVEERVDSDHVPVCITMATSRTSSNHLKEELENKRKGAEEKDILSWSEKNIAKFKEKTSIIEGEIRAEVSAQSTWDDLIKVISKAIKLVISK